jgi:hypothetical protein
MAAVATVAPRYAAREVAPRILTYARAKAPIPTRNKISERDGTQRRPRGRSPCCPPSSTVSGYGDRDQRGSASMAAHRRGAPFVCRLLARRFWALGKLAASPASIYHAAGEYRRAAELHEQPLAVHQRTLGPEHPDALTSRNNLHQTQAAAELDDEHRT